MDQSIMATHVDHGRLDSGTAKKKSQKLLTSPLQDSIKCSQLLALDRESH
jgi:hypothetical protein